MVRVATPINRLSSKSMGCNCSCESYGHIWGSHKGAFAIAGVPQLCCTCASVVLHMCPDRHNIKRFRPHKINFELKQTSIYSSTRVANRFLKHHLFAYRYGTKLGYYAQFYVSTTLIQRTELPLLHLTSPDFIPPTTTGLAIHLSRLYPPIAILYQQL